MTHTRRVDDPDVSPLAVEFVDRDDLSRGDYVLVLPGERIGVEGRIERVDVQPEAVDDSVDIGQFDHDGEPAVEDEEGKRRLAEEDDRISADDTVRNAIVIVRVGRRGLVPWLPAGPAGTVVRLLLVVALLVVALAGTGFGAFNPMDDYTRGTDSFDDPSPTEATPTPSAPPPVTVTPPATTTPTASEQGTTTPDSPDETTPPDPPDASTPSATETPTTTGTTTTTETTTATGTPAATATRNNGSGNSGGRNTGGGNNGAPPDNTAGPSAAIDVSVTGVGDVRQRDGLVNSVTGTVDGTLTVAGGADRTVVVVQSWVPGEGWAEITRVTRTDGGTLSLADVLGELTLASGNRAAAFDNPVDGTTTEPQGQVSVTAVMFDGGEEVARVSATDDYAFRVTNLAGGNGSLALGDENDTDSQALFGDGGIGSGGGNGTTGGGGDAGADSGVVAPGTNGTNSIPLRNRGSEPGTLSLSEVSFVSYENGLTVPESAVDSTGGDPGRGAGELQEALELRMALVRADGSQTWVVGNESAYRSVDVLANSTVELGVLAPDEQIELIVEYRVPDDTGNDIQSDSIVVDISFTLVGGD